MTLNWDAEESSFPQINPWEFYTSASDEQGESAVLQVRVDPTLVERLNDLVDEARLQGLPVKSRSGLLRFGIMRGIQEVYRHISMMKGNETIAHWLLLEKEAQQVAYRSEMLVKVKAAVRSLCTGLEVLIHKDQQDWGEARDRLTQFLIPILSMAGDQDFLMKMYIRSLFGYKPFHQIYEALEEHNALGNVIRNASSAFEKMKSGEDNDKY